MKPANIKGARYWKVRDRAHLLFCAHTLCLSYIIIAITGNTSAFAGFRESLLQYLPHLHMRFSF